MLMKCSQTQVTSRPHYIIYVTTYNITLKIKKKKNSVVFIKLSWYLLLTSLHHFQVKFNYSYHLSSGEFSYQHQKQFPRTSHYVHISQFDPLLMFVFVNALLRFCPSLYTYLSFKESKCNTLTARTCSIEILRNQKKNLNPPIVKILIRR